MSSDERLVSLEDIARFHDARMSVLEENMVRLANLQVQQAELLGEVRRDSQRTQRLWTRLARKYGWLEDEDFT
jgi:hypothetical protein